jgi:dGTPase
VRTAHAEPGPAIEAAPAMAREEREAHERTHLVPGATLASGAGNRGTAEEPDALRTCFQRDRDRILHQATAFRRLAGKTQVFIFPDDHQRTRLTHALEVAQVATAIARSLRLNVALTEAIALGHDCGHGPGGHASEDAFDPYLADGFDHASWGADVVLAPLNLCVETLDGIRNHSWSRPVPATPEGEVVSWADRIAYVCHDFEDATRAGVIGADALPAVVGERCGVGRSAWLRAFIGGVVDGTTAAGRVAMVDALAEALAAFRTLNYERIYLRPESMQQARAVIAVLQALVEHYAHHPDLLGLEVDPGSIAALTEAVAWVAGMTDRYACATAVHLLDWPEHELPQGLTGRR